MSQSLIPQSDRSLLEVDMKNNIMPSKTFYIDFESKKILGMVDDKKAIEQSIYLALKTERYNYLIFSWNYGEEMNKLVGKPKDLARAELPRLLNECLLVDDRISAIEDLIITEVEEGLHVSFTAVTLHGDILIEREVKI
ncbi:DUF2634 domain-containing protein [Zhenhengia yiwuensis]|uniref:DUF2634 domain-containing protein n=1 Tax=Zhenhengia yiwuensis TaxID=2763666 RepID=UPI00204D6024|nr:DUF2634 domain-containing protein [Zhenhengia yiwuensis]MDY3367460.1 DUF2634 domain-containing protein [Zhenhengia yiwuensis]DAG79686.1 MAG TPA: Protein of unknown function (DUF2634) [Caudoviricetes sp.]DAI93728.1 MAG TPA: Protein of unknown function (DUF2634) [Caudoviricetes sp.]